nr:MAG: RNA dependent RNA polymerase [Moniliophthora roreri-associated narnavirus 2]
MGSKNPGLNQDPEGSVGESPLASSDVPQREVEVRTINLKIDSGRLTSNVGIIPQVAKANFAQYSGKDLMKRCDTSPIIGLCLRLATFSTQKWKIYDPKGHLYGKNRLFRMIGFKLRSKEFKTLSRLKPRQWNTLECIWVALMHTVLLNQDFDPTKRDYSLLNSIKRFKIWFLKFGLRTDHNGQLINLDKLLKGSKSLAAGLQWYLLSDMGNPFPPELNFWPGFNPEVSPVPRLTWMAGHLERWGRPDLRSDGLTKSDLLNLCQIRTFGRALPPPSKKMCREDLRAQLEVLCSEPEPIDPEKDRLARRVMSAYADQINLCELPTHTHTSVSTSGCFERSVKDGGQAAYVRTWIQPMMEPYVGFNVIRHTDKSVIPLKECLEFVKTNGPYAYDAYGNNFFPGGLRKTLIGSQLRLVDTFFRRDGDGRRRDIAEELMEPKVLPLPNNLGLIILWISSAFALTQGEFVDESTGLVVEPNYSVILPLEEGEEVLHLPIWLSRRTLRYRPRVGPLVRMTCLAEPGAKTRSLGNTQAWFCHVTRVMRFMIEPIIARDGRTRIGLRSTNKMWSFLKFLEKAQIHGAVLQSTDYKAATDFICFPLIRILWEPFLEKIPRDHPFLVYKELLFVPRRLEVGEGFESCKLDDMTHRQASFMGEPLSFMTLALANILFEEYSTVMYNYESSILSGKYSRDAACICGDDFAAIRNSVERITVFKQAVKDFRMKLSWKDGVSRRVLIFCEDHVLYHEGKFYYVDVIKSRLLTSMTRQHSDNRSSILGKGRMLRNQLDYIDEVNPKVMTLTIFKKIFNRVYDGAIDCLRLPYFLPPSCGGLGFPIMEDSIPEFGWKYIKYIFDLLEEEDQIIRFYNLCRLRSLNCPSKKGINTVEESLKVLNRELARYQFIPDIEWSSDLSSYLIPSNGVFTDNLIKELVKLFFNREIPPDPYDPTKFDWDSLKNEASILGFLKFDELFDQIDRLVNFQEFLTSDHQREQRTFNQWKSSSAKYWKRAIGPNFEKVSLRDPRFKTFAHLERKVLYASSGWVLDHPESLMLHQIGPSMKVDFSSGRKISQKFTGEGPVMVNSILRRNHVELKL